MHHFFYLLHCLHRSAASTTVDFVRFPILLGSVCTWGELERSTATPRVYAQFLPGQSYATLFRSVKMYSIHVSKIDRHDFYLASSYASAVLAVVILSVCLSACPSVTRVLYDKTKQVTADIFYIIRKGNHFSFLTPTVVSGRRSLSSEICAQSNPPLRNTPTSTDFRL